MLRFAVLTHDHPHLHWDLLLEQPDRELLRAWRLEQPPEPGVCIPAEALPDHRRVYLAYEGPLSGNRGEVRRWDFGELESLAETAAKIELRLQGGRISGAATLTRHEGQQWTFCLAANS